MLEPMYRCGLSFDPSTADMSAGKGCTEQTEKRCINCRLVFYCSIECQRADWPTHKHACVSVQVAQELQRGSLNSEPLCQTALSALTSLPPGRVQLKLVLDLMLAQLAHEAPHRQFMELATANLALLEETSEFHPVAMSLLQLIRALEYNRKNTDEPCSELESLISSLERYTEVASASAATLDLPTIYFLKFMASYLRGLHCPVDQRLGLYWQALLHSKQYADSYRKLVTEGKLAPRALYDVWNPLAGLAIHTCEQLVEYERGFIIACFEINGIATAVGSSSDAAVGRVINDFVDGVEFGIIHHEKGKNRYEIALLRWNTSLFCEKLVAYTTSEEARRAQVARSLEVSRVGLKAARRAGHGALVSKFETELKRLQVLRLSLSLEPGAM